MDEWREGKLADVCDSIDYGLTASATDNPAGPKFLRITDIVGNALNWRNVPYVQASEKNAEKFKLNDGDIVIARTGATTGESRYIMDPPHAVFASYLVRLRINQPNDPRFISYWLKSPAFRGYLQGVLGDKSAQPNASASTMVQAPINIPANPEEQRAIAAVLGVLDDKIELNRRMNETLEAMARSIFKDWFVDFGPTRAKANGRAPYLAPELWDLFPDALDDEGKPNRWRHWTLAEFATLHRETISPATNPERLFEHYSIPAYDAGQEPRLDPGSSIKSNKTIVPSDAILLSKLNPDIPRAWIPNPLDARPQIASTEFLAFTPKAPATGSVLYCLFGDANFRREMEAMVTGTSKSHQRVSPKALIQRRILYGTASVFEQFDRQVSGLLSRVLRDRAESLTLAETRDLLLPKLISGEIRLREAEKTVEAVV